MIVVAIIGILGAVALPAYQDYIRSANAAKVLKQYTDGQKYVQSRFAQASVEESLGLTPAFPTTSAEWIAELNPTGALAPGGGPAWTAGAGDANSGELGIVFTGTWGGGDAQVVLTKPAYAGFTVDTTTFTDQ